MDGDDKIQAQQEHLSWAHNLFVCHNFEKTQHNYFYSVQNDVGETIYLNAINA